MKYYKDLKEHKNILRNKKFKMLEKFIAHGSTNLLKHSISVAILSLIVANKLKMRVNKKELIQSAILHDLYLYDWHKKQKYKGLHGLVHSKIAADEAKKEFNVNDRVYSNILSHMWPLNITKIPKTKEGIIVCIADKICSIKEIVNNEKRR